MRFMARRANLFIVSIPFISFQSREHEERAAAAPGGAEKVSIPFISFQSRERDLYCSILNYAVSCLNPFHLFSEQGTRNKTRNNHPERRGLNPFHLFSEQGTNWLLKGKEAARKKSQSLSSLFRAGNDKDYRQSRGRCQK